MTAVYTVREVADLLRCSPNTVYRAIDAGQLPAVRLMGVVRVPVSALDALTLPHASAIAVGAASSGSAVADAAPSGAAGASPRVTEPRRGSRGSVTARAPEGASLPAAPTSTL